jgi:hypothetical protein
MATVLREDRFRKLILSPAGSWLDRLLPVCQTFEDHWVFAITVRNGKLTNIREYIDTQALARACEMPASPRL